MGEVQIFELRIEASGEVRDEFGNLVEQVPISQTVELTEDQVSELLAGQPTFLEQQGESG